MKIECKINNNKLQIPVNNFWWQSRKIIAVCLLFILLFVTPVSANIVNGEFTSNVSNWSFSYTSGVVHTFNWYAINGSNGGAAVDVRSFTTSSGIISQSFDVTDVDFLEIRAYYVDGYQNGLQAVMANQSMWMNTISFNTFTLNVSTLTGVQELQIIGHSDRSDYYFTRYRVDYVREIVGFSSPTISFNPNVNTTNSSQLYYDYVAGTNYSGQNNFVYSFYEPDTLNIPTFEGYVNDSGTNISLSPKYVNGNYSIGLYTGPFGPASLLDATLLASDNIYVNASDPTNLLEFVDTPYTEYDTAIVNYDISGFRQQYPNDEFYMELLVPQSSYYPFYYEDEFLLTANTGTRSAPMGAVSNDPTANIKNCSAWIVKKNSTDIYHSLENYIYADVAAYNHTLLNFTQFDYPTNKSYVTGQYIYLLSDIKEYIQTDYLGYPDEQFTLWINGYSNSNEGNVEQSYILDSGWWIPSTPYNHETSYQPYHSSNFNATLESHISVYRNGVTTQLTPTVYSKMYASGYIPEGEIGYIPPNSTEPPVEPPIEPPVVPPINPNSTNPIDYPTGTNSSINTTWIDGYYDKVNSSLDTVLIPLYNFTNYSLQPINYLNDSIGVFNKNMNTSFTDVEGKITILSKPFNIIFNAFPAKIILVITYYLIWLLLLLVLKKR